MRGCAKQDCAWAELGPCLVQQRWKASFWKMWVWDTQYLCQYDKANLCLMDLTLMAVLFHLFPLSSLSCTSFRTKHLTLQYRSLTFFNVHVLPASGQDNTWLREGCTVIKDWFTVIYVPYCLVLSKCSDTEQSFLNACECLKADLFSHACTSNPRTVSWTTDNLCILLVSYAFSLHQMRAFITVVCWKLW